MLDEAAVDANVYHVDGRVVELARLESRIAALRSSLLPHAETVQVAAEATPVATSTAAWLARAGREVTVLDAARFPRDKTCGDGLTPRAML